MKRKGNEKKRKKKEEMERKSCPSVESGGAKRHPGLEKSSNHAGLRGSKCLSGNILATNMNYSKNN